mmetsp:Transcript_99466/g.276803  ORF Transcript_99466/g.276803 Transcript_99466/m.276803 type:complete len:154 (+) Transcript_99466:133-594(+)
MPAPRNALSETGAVPRSRSPALRSAVVQKSRSPRQERVSIRQSRYEEEDGFEAFSQSSGGGNGGFGPGARVYIGNLPKHVTESTLMRKFRTYGEVLGLKLIIGRPGGGRNGAIIRFSSPAGADAAIAALKDKLDIRLAKPNPRWDRDRFATPT